MNCGLPTSHIILCNIFGDKFQNGCQKKMETCLGIKEGTCLVVKISATLILIGIKE
jgi:hypothetical protein